MAATSKAALLEITAKEFEKLEKLVDGIETQTAQAKDDDDNSIKDIVAHRAHWIGLFLGWHRDGLAGREVFFPAEGYKWNDLKRYNADLRHSQATLGWPDAQAMLVEANETLVTFIEGSAESDLYGGPMVGANNQWTPGRWAEAAGASHYRSAAKYIRARLRDLDPVMDREPEHRAGEHGAGLGFPGAAVPPPSLPGYDHIQRFHDPRLGRVSAKILPGEFYVTADDELVTTLLGSCVAACIWDPVADLGGMNHFMIPNAGATASAAEEPDNARYGLFAMEFLINSILTHGGRRHRLVAKLAGGGHVLQGSTAISIGSENVRFARDYLAAEGIDLISEHVEGDHARRVAFHPRTGRCRVQELANRSGEIVETERHYATSLGRTSSPGDIELF